MPVAGGVKSILFFRNDMPATSDMRGSPGMGREAEEEMTGTEMKQEVPCPLALRTRMVPPSMHAHS